MPRHILANRQTNKKITKEGGRAKESICGEYLSPIKWARRPYPYKRVFELDFRQALRIVTEESKLFLYAHTVNRRRPQSSYDGASAPLGRWGKYEKDQSADEKTKRPIIGLFPNWIHPFIVYFVSSMGWGV